MYQSIKTSNGPTKFGVALTIPEFEDTKMVMKDLREMVDLMYTNCLNTQGRDDSGYLGDSVTSPSIKSTKYRVIQQKLQQILDLMNFIMCDLLKISENQL